MKEIRIYSIREKLELLLSYSNSGMSKSKFQQLHGLGHSTLTKWFNIFAEEEPPQPQESRAMKLTKPLSEPVQSAKEEFLERENARLRKALEYEKLRSLAYNTMIDIAQRELNVDIRKKSGAKQ